MTAKRSIVSRFFLGTWHLIDGARKLALNLLFLLFMYFVVMALIDTGETLVIQPDTALILQPYGTVVEQYSGTPLDYAIQQATETAPTETNIMQCGGSAYGQKSVCVVKPGALVYK